MGRRLLQIVWYSSAIASVFSTASASCQDKSPEKNPEKNQSTQTSSASNPSANSTSRPSDDRKDAERKDGERDRRDGDHKDGDHKDGDRREGGRRDGDRDGHRGDMERNGPQGEFRFLHFLFRRDGNALELLQLLQNKDVQRELGLDEKTYQPKLEQYAQEMQARFEAARKQARDNKDADFEKSMKAWLVTENKEFEKTLGELSPAQRDRLLGLFVQARNARAVSNRLVAEKLGLNEQQLSSLRDEIDTIREQSMKEFSERARREFDNGGNLDELKKQYRAN